MINPEVDCDRNSKLERKKDMIDSLCHCSGNASSREKLHIGPVVTTSWKMLFCKEVFWVASYSVLFFIEMGCLLNCLFVFGKYFMVLSSHLIRISINWSSSVATEKKKADCGLPSEVCLDLKFKTLVSEVFEATEN